MHKTLLFIFLSFFCGCSYIPFEVVHKKSETEVKLQTIISEQEIKISELNKKMTAAESEFKKNFDANVSLGTASVWSSYDTLLSEPTKSKYDLAAIDGLNVAISALPEPSIKDYKSTSETQRKLLSEQAVLIEQGKKEIEQYKNSAEESKQAQAQLQTQISNLNSEKSQIQTSFEQEKEKLTSEIIKQKNDKLVASEEAIKAAQEKKDLQMLVVRILMVFGVIAGIVAALAKNKTIALASAAAIILAISVSFIPTYILVLLLVGVFGIAGFGLFNEYKEHKTALKNVVGATQEFKTSNEEVFKEGLAKNLQEWNKEDPKVVATIDKTLKDLNLK